ncbi:prepilin peptidase [Lentisphaerota bacterium ZTH]|nr:prepilin peptidase [Lentisphaerota bacterium]WET07093.1 prepilin peptidase [Lentisphaerota bacterium ZTH]
MPAFGSFQFLPQMMPFWYFMSFIIGCCIGSFLNVCIYRIPAGKSLSMPPSHCPKCRHRIRWYENIPLLSWLVLRGQCSSCKCRIPARYFLVELLTGLLFFVLFFKVTLDRQPTGILLVYYGMTMLIVTTAFIDYEHRIIPNKTTYPAMLLGLVAALLFPQIWHTTSHFKAFLLSLASLIGCTVFMAAFAITGKMIFKRDALGWGDVKYIAAVGACLGPLGAFFTLLFGSLTGTLAGVGIMLRKRTSLKTAIPFGPFLAAGTYLWMVFGERLTSFYLSFFPQ